MQKSKSSNPLAPLPENSDEKNEKIFHWVQIQSEFLRRRAGGEGSLDRWFVPASYKVEQ